MADVEARLAEMGERIVKSGQRDAAAAIGRRLLEANGSVSAAEVEAALVEEWSPPSGRELADRVALKAQSAATFERDQLAAHEEGIERLRAKAERLRAQAEDADASVEAALAEREQLTARIQEADQVAAEALRRGDPAAAPQPAVVEVLAESAAGTGEVPS